MSEPTVQMKYEVRDEAAEAKLKEIGTLVKDTMPPGYGFTLLIYTYGAEGNLFYLSSAKREDMIRTMQEFIAKFREN